MNIERRKLQKLLTLNETAGHCGITPSKMWRLVYLDGLLPKPTTEFGRRVYYREADVAEVKKAVASLIRGCQGE